MKSREFTAKFAAWTREDIPSRSTFTVTVTSSLEPESNIRDFRRLKSRLYRIAEGQAINEDLHLIGLKAHDGTVVLEDDKYDTDAPENPWRPASDPPKEQGDVLIYRGGAYAQVGYYSPICETWFVWTAPYQSEEVAGVCYWLPFETTLPDGRTVK